MYDEVGKTLDTNSRVAFKPDLKILDTVSHL